MTANDRCFFLHMETWHELARTTSTPAAVLMLHLWLEREDDKPVRCTVEDTMRWLKFSRRSACRARKELRDKNWIESHSRSLWTVRPMPKPGPGDTVNGEPWELSE